MNSKLQAIVNSALWAAYGDALGYLTELTDKTGLRKRIDTDVVQQTVKSHRNIGGKFGVIASLPAGCYSDDTQLRLSTSRAIRGDGEFDVEAFAKVELPVWLSYSLGAGRGTKVAASAFRKSDVNWFSNFYEEDGVIYTEGGGNGAAMRIQPHVWAASARNAPESYLTDVIKNSICTHGHPRAFLGAVFHAFCLAYAIEKGVPPGPTEWKEAIYLFEVVPNLIKNNYELSNLWLSKWELKSKYSLDDFVHEVEVECLDDIRIIEGYLNQKPAQDYNNILHALGALKDQFRGTGTKTAILASVLAWIYRNDSPSEALCTSANALKSDTDTIATMAGAIIGATTSLEPDGVIMDKDYIVREATRMYQISVKEAATTFHYPDLQKWEPPRIQLDAVRYHDGSLFLSGISKVVNLGEAFEVRGNGETIWQWSTLEFGQQVLAKRRKNLVPISSKNIPVTPLKIEIPKVSKSEAKIGIDHPSLFARHDKTNEEEIITKNESPYKNGNTNGKSTLELLTDEVIFTGFKAETIGKNFLILAQKSSSIEDAIGFAAIIMKALNARKRRAGK